MKPEHSTNFIPLFHKQCKDCGHLFKDERTLYENCHYSKGNAACPARTIYIGVGVNIEKASTGVADAIINQDAIQLARLAERLKGYEPEQTKQVLAAVRERVLNSYGITIDAEGDFVQGEDDAAVDGEDDDEEDEIDGDGVDAFAQEALVAIIDERVTLLLIQHQLIASPEPLSPTPLPLDAPVIAGSAVVVGSTDAPVSSDAVTSPVATDTSVEDDWAET